MQNKTVKELRELARDKGIVGYSRMRKEDLLDALAALDRKLAAKATRSPRKRTESSPTPPVDTTTDPEQRVEDAKYAVNPPGTETPHSPAVDDLREPIDELPSVARPALSLLPQKPGVLHGYWSLEPGRLQRQPGLHLRLSYVSEHQATILEEVPLPSDQGRWYFHVDPDLPAGEVYLQLGHYGPDGEFVSAAEHGVVRLPRLYASSNTDRAWWISDEDFRRLYLRAGGLLRGGRLSWGGAVAGSWPSSWSGVQSGGMGRR